MAKRGRKLSRRGRHFRSIGENIPPFSPLSPGLARENAFSRQDPNYAIELSLANIEDKVEEVMQGER
jgi:hypothetical protein